MNRRWLKRLVAAVAVLWVGALLVAAGDWYATRRTDARRLHEALAQLDADDPDWHVVGVVKAHNAAIPDDDAQNVGRVMVGALGWRPPSRQARDRAISAHEIPDLERDDDRLPHDDAFCSLYEVHTESTQAIREAMSVRRMKSGGFPLHHSEPDPFGTLLPDLQKMHEGANLLKDAATVEAYFGRGDEALRAADAALHLGQTTLSSEPLAISQLVRMAIAGVSVDIAQQSLAWTEPTPAELANLQGAFARAAEFNGMTDALRGERAVVMRLCDNVRSGALPDDHFETLFGGNRIPWEDRLESRAMRRPLAAAQLDGLKEFNELIAVSRAGRPARTAACRLVRGQQRPRDQVQRLVSACVKYFDADDQTRARLRCATVALACERFRIENGRWPVILDEIPTAVLPAVPTDPYTDKPLLYRQFDGGIVVYCTGPDGTDDGGEVLTTTGLPLRKTDGVQKVDIGFPLWNPESRRRPPFPRFDPDIEDPLARPGDAP